MMSMNWNIKDTLNTDPNSSGTDSIIECLLKNRKLTTKELIAGFLHPNNPLEINPDDVEIDRQQLNKAIGLINQAIAEKTPIIVYGDYDADGITASAVLWEALHSLGANAVPFIPSREKHGYGLSINGLKDALSSLTSSRQSLGACLVVTVDNGIVAHEQVKWLHQQGIRVVITDHHQPHQTLPAADAVIHSELISGAGVAWFMVKELDLNMAKSSLDLVCIGTVADMMPLIGVNRSLVKFGLPALRQCNRPGISAMFADALIDSSCDITPYHINYIIAPRLNAMGRLEHALDSLRLICTKNPDRAVRLSKLLSDTNKDRQDLTEGSLNQAIGIVGAKVKEKIIVIDHDTFHEGVIGLIASKLVETYYRPAIVISRKDGISKASARSISGVNITEMIRSQIELLEGVGGHPMAAGFSIKTDKIDIFKQEITNYSKEYIHDSLLTPTMDIECLVNFSDLNDELYHAIQELQPFGIGNPQPVFALNKAECLTVQRIGKNNQHLKLSLRNPQGAPMTGLWFGHGSWADSYQPNQPVNLAFTLDQNTWRDRTTLQLMIKDIK